MAYRLDVPLRLVGWLYAATGVTMLLAPFLAFQGQGGLAGAGLLFPLGALVLAAGVGLLRQAAWAWPSTFVIAASGAIVTGARLWVGGPWTGLGPILITNVLTLVALIRARGAARGGPEATR
jgi:hypothetical protein